jgi:ABC-type nitrate/sulfonate/bicarbonate transport system permease component
MLRAGSLYDIPSVFAGAIFLVALAIILNYLVGLIENNRIKVVKFFSVDSSINKF